MRSKAKWFIGISSLVIVLLCAGIYVNYRLDKVVSSLNRSGVLFSEKQSGVDSQGEVAEKQSNGDYWNKSWDNETGGTDSQGNNGNGNTGSTGNASSSGSTGNASSGDKVSSPPSDSQIANDVANKIGRPVDKTDMIKAGLIILRRMNGSEISYLYQVGRKGSMSSDERVKVHEILHNKLNSDDITTLKALGIKYGRDLSILDN